MPTESVLIFKPDASRHLVEVRNDLYLLHEIGRSLLIMSGLEITQHVTKQLTRDNARSIYAKVLAPNPEDDAIYGIQWKEDVVAHMSSCPVEAYFVYDRESDAVQKAKSVKNFLRKSLVPTNNVVENIAHVPEEDEYCTVRGILLGHE